MINSKCEHSKVHIYVYLNMHMYIWIRSHMNNDNNKTPYLPTQFMGSHPTSHYLLPYRPVPRVRHYPYCVSSTNFCFLHISLYSYYLVFVAFDFLEMEWIYIYSMTYFFIQWYAVETPSCSHSSFISAVVCRVSTV